MSDLNHRELRRQWTETPSDVDLARRVTISAHRMGYQEQNVDAFLAWAQLEGAKIKEGNIECGVYQNLSEDLRYFGANQVGFFVKFDDHTSLAIYSSKPEIRGILIPGFPTTPNYEICISELAKFKNLKSLSIQGNIPPHFPSYGLKNNITNLLESAPNLTTLHLPATRLGLNEVRQITHNLTNLEDVDFSYNTITARSIPLLIELDNLKIVSLAYTKIGRQGAHRLSTSALNWNCLDVSGNHYVLQELINLSEMPNLREFYADDVWLTDIDSKRISLNTPSLEVISLRGNPISDKCLDELDMPKSVQRLYIEGTQVSEFKKQELREKGITVYD